MVTLDARALLPNALAAIGGTSVEHLIVGSIAGALPPAKSMLYRLFSRHDIAPRPQDARLGRLSDLLANENDGAPDAVDTEQDVAIIHTTAGTTGRHKGAMITQHNHPP